MTSSDSTEEYVNTIYRDFLSKKHKASLFSSCFSTPYASASILDSLQNLLCDEEYFVVFPPMFIRASDDLVLTFSAYIRLYAFQSGPIVPVLLGKGTQITLDELHVLYADRTNKQTVTRVNAASLLL